MLNVEILQSSVPKITVRISNENYCMRYLSIKFEVNYAFTTTYYLDELIAKN